MTEEQIKKLVRITVDELTREQIMEEPKKTAIKKAERSLKRYFAGAKGYEYVGDILKTLADDEYIDIIYLRYEHKKTVEEIAEKCNKDASTIRRNNKRLLKKIYVQLKRG